jgi:hypothetical protein
MKILFILITLFTLVGCETFGEAIRAKRYTVNIHETPNSVQTFGYNTDYDYIGFMIHGNFGRVSPKHTHTFDFSRKIENNSE